MPAGFLVQTYKKSRFNEKRLSFAAWFCCDTALLFLQRDCNDLSADLNMDCVIEYGFYNPF
jgi:hypothetical protein